MASEDVRLVEEPEIEPGLGIHEPHAEWDTCIAVKGEHICWKRHGHTVDHRCACDAEWPYGIGHDDYDW